MILQSPKQIESWVSLENKIENILKAGENLDINKIYKNLEKVLPNYQPRNINSINEENKLRKYNSLKAQA